jgi:hypothetical protein
VNRLIAIASAASLALLILVPVASAASPIYEDGRVVVTVRGDITFPAGEHAESLVVVDGSATIEGDVESLFVINGTASFVGSETQDVVAVASHVSVDGASVISGDIRTIDATVERAPGSIVRGTIDDGIDLGRWVWFVGTALLVAYVGFVIAAIAGAVLLAGLAARQVRSAEAVLLREPGTAFLAGLGVLVAIIVAATLAIVTVVGIPLGLGLLVGLLPVMAFAGYLVAAISIGDWILGQTSPGRTTERPYLAAVVGILVVAVISVIPGVGGIVSFMGFGAVSLLMWRTLRGQAGPAEPIPQHAIAPAAG